MGTFLVKVAIYRGSALNKEYTRNKENNDIRVIKKIEIAYSIRIKTLTLTLGVVITATSILQYTQLGVKFYNILELSMLGPRRKQEICKIFIFHI
jgi:hypothetical protein